MSRTWTLVGIAAIALGAAAPAAGAATTDDAAKGGEVRALSIVPAAGRAEVVIALDANVEVSDFALASPPRIILDLRGATFTGQARLYDKVPRGGIVNMRVAQYRNDVVRVVIELDNDHKYTLKRTNDALHVTIDGVPGANFGIWRTSPEFAAAAPAAERGPDPILRGRANVAAAHQVAFVSSSAQPRITVTYVDADIRDVIAAFALFSGRTIVVGKGVSGTVTAEVRDQPWDVALRAILQSQGLAAKEDADGIITVDSFENIGKQQQSEPLTTQLVSLNYARASSLVLSVQSLLSRECGGGAGLGTTQASPGYSGAVGNCQSRGQVTFDSASNRLIITDVSSRLADIANYIRDLDIRTPQVAIKAKIIQVNRTSIQDIGVSYDLGTATTFFNQLLQRPDPSTFKPVDTNGDGVPDAVVGQNYNKNQAVVNIGGNSLAAVTNANQRVVNPALSLLFTTTIGKFNLTAFIDALQETRLADVQAEPSVVTLDNKKAEIMSGQEVPIRVVDVGSLSQGGSQATAPRATVAFKETGIILNVIPHITNNRRILLIVHAERSVVTPASADLGYVIDKQRADNELLVADGETAVIGGLTDSHVNQDKTGIPILIDLPFVGKLFGETRTEEVKDDLLILITPHIVDEDEVLGAPGSER
jgi:type IV pilus assembly protein PilQ